MEAIWIIIVIVAVIMRIFNKVEDFKGKLPRDWGDPKLPPVFKDWEFPWDDEQEAEGELPGERCKDQPVRTRNEGASQEEQVTGGSRGDSIRNDSPDTPVETYSTAYDIAVPDSKSGDRAFEGHPLLNTDTIISGIIMSELLQPPKSKRPRWRNT